MCLFLDVKVRKQGATQKGRRTGVKGDPKVAARLHPSEKREGDATLEAIVVFCRQLKERYYWYFSRRGTADSRVTVRIRGIGAPESGSKKTWCSRA